MKNALVRRTGLLGAALLVSLAMPCSASAQSRAAPVRWEHRCGFIHDQSLQNLQRLLNEAGLDGWELVAVWPDIVGSSEAESGNRHDVDGFNYCVKRPLGQAPLPSPPPTPPPPAEQDFVAALGSTRALLTQCRDTYARGTRQLAVSVTIAPSGRVQEATLSDAANGQLASCVERALKLVSLPRFRGQAAVVRTTVTLP
jgi:hypothetical protein